MKRTAVTMQEKNIEEKMKERSHKEAHHDERRSPQDRVDKQARHFSDEH
jgi:hypothetical protein